MDVLDRLDLQVAKSPALKHAVEMIAYARDQKFTVPPPPAATSEVAEETVADPAPNVEAAPAPAANATHEEVMGHLHEINILPALENGHVPESKWQESYGRFKDFFTVLRHNAVGRNDLIQLIEYSLIAGGRQNMLLLGSTGVGKSFVADMLGQIKDRSGNATMFKLLMTPETTRSEVDGPLSYSKVQEDKFERLTNDSILNFRLGFLDEIFDYPRIRNLLNALEEGVLRQGAQQFKGKLDFAIGATNKFISEIVMNLRGENARAPQDRFAFIYVVPNELSTVAENKRLLRQTPLPLPDLYYQDFEELRKIVDQTVVPEDVENELIMIFQTLRAETAMAEKIASEEYVALLKSGNRPSVPPYRSTRVFSNRSLKRAMRIVKTMAAHEWLAKGGQGPVAVDSRHLGMMAEYYGLGGPKGAFLQRLIAQTHEPLEKQQYEIVEAEGQRFREARRAVKTQLESHELNTRLRVFEDALAQGQFKNSPEHRDTLQKLFRYQEDLTAALHANEKRMNEDGLMTAETVLLPSLQDRYNKVIGQLGL